MSLKTNYLSSICFWICFCSLSLFLYLGSLLQQMFGKSMVLLCFIFVSSCCRWCYFFLFFLKMVLLNGITNEHYDITSKKMFLVDNLDVGKITMLFCCFWCSKQSLLFHSCCQTFKEGGEKYFLKMKKTYHL